MPEFKTVDEHAGDLLALFGKPVSFSETTQGSTASCAFQSEIRMRGASQASARRRLFGQQPCGSGSRRGRPSTLIAVGAGPLGGHGSFASQQVNGFQRSSPASLSRFGHAMRNRVSAFAWSGLDLRTYPPRERTQPVRQNGWSWGPSLVPELLIRLTRSVHTRCAGAAPRGDRLYDSFIEGFGLDQKLRFKARSFSSYSPNRKMRRASASCVADHRHSPHVRHASTCKQMPATGGPGRIILPAPTG